MKTDIEIRILRRDRDDLTHLYVGLVRVRQPQRVSRFVATRVDDLTNRAKRSVGEEPFVRRTEDQRRIPVGLVKVHARGDAEQGRILIPDNHEHGIDAIVER